MSIPVSPCVWSPPRREAWDWTSLGPMLWSYLTRAGIHRAIYKLRTGKQTHSVGVLFHNILLFSIPNHFLVDFLEWGFIFQYKMEHFHRNIWKLVRVRTSPVEFENAALFLLLGLPSTLIRHENEAFRKCSSNRRNLKKRVCVFVWTENLFENGTFRKRWRHDNHVIFLTEFSSNTNRKWPVIVVFLIPPA